MKTKGIPKLNPIISKRFKTHSGIKEQTPIEMRAAEINRHCDEFFRSRRMRVNNQDSLFLYGVKLNAIGEARAESATSPRHKGN